MVAISFDRNLWITGAAAIRDLTRESYAPWVALIGREPLPMTADYEAAARAHRFDLAYLEGNIVALIETRAEPDHLLVVNVAVKPAVQGQGVGRRLLAHAEQLALEQGLAELRLYTNVAFERNVRLYQGLGYVIDRERISELRTTVHMSKRLDAPRRYPEVDVVRQG